ncbi:uncharacterized protein LOC125031548 [Penaeus chinensis]|uniref:uncharacterized protein LOC125031548 n=1 Tax=Penaeus chinensis TaxID=139456 RepID=UPI001FB729FD|nr:uncharacterized protein LOC125031548 [Penaeus chinensis]
MYKNLVIPRYYACSIFTLYYTFTTVTGNLLGLEGLEINTWPTEICSTMHGKFQPPRISGIKNESDRRSTADKAWLNHTQELQIQRKGLHLTQFRCRLQGTSIMKTLVVLAVLGVCSASLQQAYNHGYNYVQPRYVGPLASTVPAGVDGTITPVSDTYEVAAARGAFFRAYQDQLATVNALRYGAPATHYAVHHVRQLCTRM